MTSKWTTVLAALAAAVLGLFAASWMLGGQKPPAALSSGSLLPQPRAIPAFELLKHDGGKFLLADFAGRWSLVFPGFMRCPDICPTTLAQLKNLHKTLADQGRPLQIVFLSVDPERDAPAALANYVHYFHPDFIGVTATEPALENFAKSLLITYLKNPGTEAGDYTMDHSAALVLINPQGQLAGFFTPPFQIPAMAADLAQLIEKAP